MRIYYGWVIVVLAGLIMMLVMGSTVAVFGLYVLPVAQEFGLSRADVNTAFAVSNLGGALLSPVIGRMADIFPVRRVMTAGAIFYMVGITSLGLSNNIWLSAGILALAFPMIIGGIASFGAMTLVARWFEAQRARAMALAVVGMSLGSVLVAPAIGLSLAEIGWRNTLIGQGLILGTLFLVLIFFLRERPGPDDIEPRPAGTTAPPPSAAGEGSDGPLSTKQILRIGPFWIIAGGMALGMGTYQAVSISLLPMVQESGLSVAAAAGLISIMGVTSMAGKFALAWAGDRVDKALTLGIILTLFAISVAVLPLPQGFPAIAMTGAVVGLVGGALMPLFMALLADAVGTSSFASANGMAALAMAVAGAVSIRLAGDLYDLTGGYQLLFLVLASAIAIAAVLMFICSRLVKGWSAPDRGQAVPTAGTDAGAQASAR